MSEERKKKLIGYLYPNEKSRQFLCEEIYYELADILPKYKCISTNYIGELKRKAQIKSTKELVKNFLSLHQNYIDKLKSFYKDNSLDEIVDKIIIGYVFYFTVTRDNCRNIDIFRDKRSICYAPISVIDIL